MIFVSCAAVSWMLGIAAYRLLLGCGIIDRPNQRSSHTRPTVRGGGIAIVTTVTAAAIWLLSRSHDGTVATAILCTVALAVISFVDDLRSIRARIRFGCHLLAALVVLVSFGSHRATTDFLDGAGIIAPLTATACGAVWVVGYTNGFNFMDGINGIAAGQAAITGIGMALLTGLSLDDFSATPVLLSVAIAGAALGFLPHNFPNARMFMGDAGSAPLGFLLAVLVIWQTNLAGLGLLIPLVLLHANFVLDTGITLLRRVARGERWHQAHREHFYQRLIRAGKSHAFVTGWYLALQGLVLGLMLVYLQSNGALRLVLAAGVLLIWGAFFCYCEVVFRKESSVRTREVKSPVSAVMS
jgi:UDP-N-acetylmuramyl pentapeptide phosphotransferase/UDP-N-acetylglucosamine-1-phosphate transferase